ncbi:zinc-dependent metalloprotease [Cryobacterium sp. TMT2-18-3]|nr:MULTISPECIES: zinc-dependent metalloprotease [unclassified Cryobacterium]TFC24930.1 zinc-dependent metalloprotease [Cryobacterium sp. TMT2-18-2]TFC38707.1 zinc-dependent metalloprotease [Cryobacterium sp. TMT2-42-4]TFC56402.1 zinc-dependent metalloprotease [Cryobacterium sp. TMT2-15-1]TFC60724.1 zinc-dependent metalloprotease [Cryobacterium sp. TMT2-18-3]
MLRDILSGKSSIDPSQLAGAAGLPSDPASISALMNQLQGALRGGGDGSINWDAALNQGQERAAQSQLDVTSAERAALDQAFHIASLWLDEVISVAELTTPPRLMTRKEWVTATMPLWTQLAEPVATSISDSLTRVLTDQAPEELKGMMAGAGQVMRSIGGTLFAMQLGQVVGQLSSEVVSGGDVGIPLLSDQQAALLPQNVAAFGEGLDVPADQVQIYLAVREIAHARLFRHSRWLRLHLISSITDFARGIHIDSSRLEQLADGFDPANPEELRAAMVDGSLIPPKSEAQLAALSRLETMLALIEGWVDVVTLEATSRLPRADAIAETVKRRRASGGPAESAFATLVGLELRPRRLREAAALWQAVTDAVGNEKRDELWAHPDLLPSSADLDDPQALVARLTSSAAGAEPVLDEVDQALEDLLRDDDTERPHEA